MKRLPWATPLLLLLISTATFADSVRFGLSVNDGSGDNFGFIQQPGGIIMGGGGGTPTGFFDNFPGYRPGDPFGGDVPIFFSGGSTTIGGTTYDVDWSGALFVSTFTFPTNGKDSSTLALVGTA